MTYENAKSYERYLLIHDQVRVDIGHIISLDLGAIAIVFQALGITGPALLKELQKMKIIHHHHHQEKKA